MNILYQAMRIKRISAHALSIIVLMHLDTCLYVLCNHSFILQCFTFFIQNENNSSKIQCILFYSNKTLRLLISIRFISHELTIFFYFSRMAGTVLTS